MPEFGDQLVPAGVVAEAVVTLFHVLAGGGEPFAGFQWPERFNASATSFGM
jgi:hypothetical protein